MLIILTFLLLTTLAMSEAKNSTLLICKTKDSNLCKSAQNFCFLPLIASSCKNTCGLCKETAEESKNYLHQPNCGRTNRKESRIVGGKRVNYGSHPWMANIYTIDQMIDGTYINQLCGGSVISKNWVLTAAHCLLDLETDELLVSAGDHKLGRKDKYEQRRMITKVILHEEYEISSDHNDIALLKVDKPFIFNNNVKPVCLPKSGIGIDKFKDSKCDILGWGHTTKRKRSPELRIASVKIMSQKTCSNYFEELLTSSMFCAGYHKGGIDACQGDSGGPMICQTNRKVQRGITSWGDGCAQAKKPGVYTDVSLFIKWIAEKTEIRLVSSRI